MRAYKLKTAYGKKDDFTRCTILHQNMLTNFCFLSPFTPPVQHSERQNRARGNSYAEVGHTSGPYPSRDRR